jgi:hypothetical protein
MLAMGRPIIPCLRAPYEVGPASRVCPPAARPYLAYCCCAKPWVLPWCLAHYARTRSKWTRSLPDHTTPKSPHLRLPNQSALTAVHTRHWLLTVMVRP